MFWRIVQERGQQFAEYWQLTPNKISLSRLPFGFAFLLFWPRWPWLALIVLVCGVFSDWRDGDVAKKRNMITPLGIWLDPLMDKVMMTFVWVALWLPMVGPWWLTSRLAIEVGLVVISGFHERLRLVYKDTINGLAPIQRQTIEGKMRANWSGKTKTAYEMAASICLVILGFIGYLHYVEPYGTALFAVGCFLGLMSVSVYSHNYREAKRILGLHERLRRTAMETRK